METKKPSFFAILKKAVNDYITHPKKLIPSAVLAFVWIVFAILSACGVNSPFVRFIYTLTYSKGGMFGGVFGAIGGILGKAIFAAFVTSVVNSLVEKKNPFNGCGNGLHNIFGEGAKAVFPFFVGAGIGIVLYCFFNVTANPVNCAIAVVGMVSAITAASRQNGLLFSIGFIFLGKFTKGKAPSRTAVSRVLLGLSAGFAICMPLTFTRLAWLILLIGILMIIMGIILPLMLNKANKPTLGGGKENVK